MGKNGGKQTVTSGPDAGTAAWMQNIRDAATRAGNAPPPGASSNAGMTGAAQYYGQTAAAGGLGLSAMQGDPSAVNSFMNPYQQNVIDTTQAQFGDTLKNAQNSVADMATKGGAFGGSRYGVAQGIATRGAVKDQTSLLAGLNSAGYSDAMNRAQGAANLGFSGAQAGAQLGDRMRDIDIQSNPDMWKLNMLQQGMGLGGTTTTTTGNAGKNAVNGIMGGATIGANFGVPGALVGGAAGGLLSMFG